MYFLISFFWFIRTIKAILFWFYLWQLKEYHIGRFWAHFHTEKGIKAIIYNEVILFKIFLLLFSLIFILPTGTSGVILVPICLLFVYFLESLNFGIKFFQKKIKNPVLTPKAVFLILAALFLEGLFLSILFLNIENIYQFTIWLLTFDIFSPIFISIIVLFFQPLTVLLRNQIIKKAKEKRREFKNLTVIGITGSFGKTSTKEFLATILSKKFKVLKTREHQNSEVGVSQCILQELKQEHEIFVCEMAAYNRGGIKLLCDIAKPKIGILTGINEQHMATFGSQENIIKTKYELIESLPRSQPQVVLRGLPIDTMAFFNAKNKYCLELYEKTNLQKFLYGENATFFGEENILGAIAVAKELGMTEEEISKAVEKIENRASIYGSKNIPFFSTLRYARASEGEDEGKALIAYKFPGIQIKKGVNGINIIDATYSANPDGVMAHLEYLKTIRQVQGKLVIVMPCLIELGKSSKEVHKRIGQKIGEVCDLAIITTRDRFKEIKEGAGEKAIFLEKPKKILEKIKSFCQERDVILLESRVPNELIKKLITQNESF